MFRLAANSQEPVLRVNADAEFLGEVPVANVIAELRGRRATGRIRRAVRAPRLVGCRLRRHRQRRDGGGVMEAMRILKAVSPIPAGRSSPVCGAAKSKVSTALAPSPRTIPKSSAAPRRSSTMTTAPALCPRVGTRAAGQRRLHQAMALAGPIRRSAAPSRVERRPRSVAGSTRTHSRAPAPRRSASRPSPGNTNPHLAHRPRHVRQDRLERCAKQRDRLGDAGLSGVRKSGVCAARDPPTPSSACPAPHRHSN